MLRKLISAMMFALPLSCWGWGSGLYVGGGLGGDSIDFYNKSYIKQDPTQQLFSVINTTEQAAQGIFGTGFAGYGFVREAFYLAGEANINGSTAAFKTTNKEYDHPGMQATYTRTKILPSWGLSVLPGWLLLQDTTLLYGRFGYAGGLFNITTTDSSLSGTNQVLSGIRFGVGIEKRLYKHFGVRLEYNHIIYQSNSVNHVDTSNTAVTYKHSVTTPQTNQFEFGFVYRFC